MQRVNQKLELTDGQTKAIQLALLEIQTSNLRLAVASAELAEVIDSLERLGSPHTKARDVISSRKMKSHLAALVSLISDGDKLTKNLAERI